MYEREAAILGLLCEKPLYGYTIEKIIGERGMRHWTDIGFSSLYYVLKRLESRNLIVSSCRQQENKPSRKVYTITLEGEQQMRANVRLPALTESTDRFTVRSWCSTSSASVDFRNNCMPE